MATATLTLIATSIGVSLAKFHLLPLQTIGSSFGSVVWLFHSFPSGPNRVDFGSVHGPAFAIAILSAFQSLDAMDLAGSLAGERYSSKIELLVQGIANLGCSLVGGLPISGSYIDTFTNVPGGGQTPAAGMLQSVFLLVVFFVATPLVPFIPLPVISAVLISSVLTLSQWKEVPSLVRLSWGNSSAWFATFSITITTDLLTAAAVAMLIGMFLYIQKHRLQV